MDAEKKKEMPCEILFFDETIKDIFPREVQLEKLGDGFSFTEGPVWIDKEERLYFTDFPHERIYYYEKEKGVVLFREQSHRAIGLTKDQRENIISAESRLHRIGIIRSTDSEGLIEQYQGKRFNSPNDVIVSKKGDIFFTDPLSAALGKPGEQGFNGVYHGKSDGEVDLVSDEFAWPNGLCLNNDESILYVNDTGENTIYKLAKLADGRYGKREKFFELDADYGEGACDGMKVDSYDHIWVTGPGGIWVLAPTKKCLTIIKCPEFVGNFCFGGKHGDEVFITASTSLYRLKLSKKMAIL